MSGRVSSARDGVPDIAGNLHATVVVLGDQGLAMTGQSGHGKTQLALALVDSWRNDGLFARLVSDDQTFVTASAGRVVAYAAPAIAGQAEVRGLGPVSIAFEPRAVIDMIVELTASAPRLPEPCTQALSGIELPLFRLPANDMPSCLAAVRAILRRGQV